jgi:hypothetical protein
MQLMAKIKLAKKSFFMFPSGLYYLYSERQKYGINSLKIKQNFLKKNLWPGQF